MKANKRQITIILGSILLAMMSTGCSSDNQPEVPEFEYKTSASNLNGHLEDDWQRMPEGMVMYPIHFTAHDAPDITRYAYAEMDVVEIPGKGGTYDLEIGKSWELHEFKVYENVPFLSHDKDGYDNYLFGEYLTYNLILKNRPDPDWIIDMKGYNYITGSSETKRKSDRIVTYTFPENRTGLYRLMILGFEAPWSNPAFPPYVDGEYEMVERFCYFIQMPD